MGYTHYWEIQKQLNVQDEDWLRFCLAVSADLWTHKDVIQREYNNSEPPLINQDQITFNGKDDNGHETFSLERSSEGFHFCKTREKPYDRAVVNVLLLAKEHFPGWLRLSSDGDTPHTKIF